MKVITEEQLKKLDRAMESTRGTLDWHKYLLECDSMSGGRWKFIGYYTPSYTSFVELKTHNGNAYMIEHNGEFKYRYHVTEAVKELLGI